MTLIEKFWHCHFVDWKPLTGTLAHGKDPDEMPHDVAFHQGLHFAKITLILRERNTIILEIITSDPSIYTMGHPCFMESSIGLKRVNSKLVVLLFSISDKLLGIVIQLTVI